MSASQQVEGCLCRHQSKRAAAADSDNMDPELRVVMLGGQENDGAAGRDNSAIASALRSDYYLDGKGIKFVHGLNSNTGSSPLLSAFVARGWHMRRKPNG